jgi:hypothetical protein
MKTEVKLITPEIAEILLKKNTMNRVLREKLIEEYARIMRVGLWKEETGEAIKIAYDGSILDGQHRLLALIRASISLNFLLITDLEKEVFTVLDTGKARSAGDIFHIAGVVQSKNHAASIVRYLRLKSGIKSVFPLDGGGRDLMNDKVSKAELYSIYIHRKTFWDASILMSDKWYTQFQRVLKLSEINSLYAFFYDINQDDAFKFMDLLCSGVNLDQNNPIKLLREKLIFSKTNLKFSFAPVQKLAIIYKTWNYFRNNQSITVLRFSREIDNFPIPV